MKRKPIALTIAGSDSGGGEGEDFAAEGRGGEGESVTEVFVDSGATNVHIDDPFYGLKRVVGKEVRGRPRHSSRILTLAMPSGHPGYGADPRPCLWAQGYP